MTAEEIVKKWNKYFIDYKMKQNGFLAAQEENIIDTTNPRIVLLIGENDKCYALVNKFNTKDGYLFSFTENKWQPVSSFMFDWDNGAYEEGEFPTGGYKEQHEVYILAKAAGFKIDPLDITIETIVSDIRDEINE